MRSVFVCIVISVIPGMLWAQDSPDVFTYKVGEIEVNLLSESQSQGDPGILIDATPEMLKQTIPEGTFPSAVNAFLIRSGGKIILVDAGLGTKLFDNLLSLGVSPKEIDVVFLTHLHGDHTGGMFRDGQNAFPNAYIYVSDPEYRYWMSDEKMKALPAGKRKGFESARRVLAAYEEKLVLFAPDDLGSNSENQLAGLKAIAAYGHTPGHTMFLVESGEDKLLIWGDLTHALPVQLAYPQLAVTYDVDPQLAAGSRIATLQYVVENNIPVAGMHVPYPGMGRITAASGSGYYFSPMNKTAVAK